jgi:DNA-binding GntR family transcriptional regulator
VNLRAMSTRESIALRIEQDILQGVYCVGEQLKQDAISQRFNVSAAPVREALRQLESDGLVIYRPNRGMFVADVSNDELFGVLLPLRLTLEKFAVRHTLKNMTEERWGLLESMVREMDIGARLEDWALINEADVRFHEMTVVWSDQPHTVRLWKGVQSRIRAQIYHLAPRHRHPDEIVAEHAELITTFRSGNSRLINKALKEHIIVSARKLLAAEAAPAGSPPYPVEARSS